MAGQEVFDIRHPATAQGFLSRVFGEGPLQRYKYQGQHQQGEDEIVEPGVEAAAVHRRHIQAPGADQCGHTGQYHADDAVALFLMTQHTEKATDKADTDADEQGNAQHLGVVEGAEFRCGQQLRVEETEAAHQRQNPQSNGHGGGDLALARGQIHLFVTFPQKVCHVLLSFWAKAAR